MTTEKFEQLLSLLCDDLSALAQAGSRYASSADFEKEVRSVLQRVARASGIAVEMSERPQVFPDITLGEFGIEIKMTQNDTWRSVANSVSEGTRDPEVKHVYLVFGKMGGTPGVKWGRYEDCVMHVRTSHRPRFEVQIDAEQSLFQKFGISYQTFCAISHEEKMRYIREYARGRLKEGERLWWLEDKPEPEQEHSLSLQVRLYMRLPQEEKRQLRAEAALLCPQIAKPSRAKKKYEDAAMYLLTYHGVLCPQSRDLFSAGSVAMRADQTRGGNYILRALQDIEPEMERAAETLEDALFVEYWGTSVRPADRIDQWLTRADGFARDWRPSRTLFRRRRE